MHILITNDDGIHAPGIVGLTNEFAKHADVTVVAPEFEQSGVSHALTFLKPINALALPSELDNVRWYAVNGTPSDCVRLGVLELCETRPDIVISGINGGLNVGINCLYSGTIGGAREGSFFEIPSFAVSLEIIHKSRTNVQHIVRASKLSRELILGRLLPLATAKTTIYNINMPIAAMDRDVEIMTVPMETQRFEYHFEKGNDPAGRPYFWTKHVASEIKNLNGTDVSAVEHGKIAITPMTYDLTDYQQIERESESQELGVDSDVGGN